MTTSMVIMRSDQARPVEERFWEKVVLHPDCWEWTGKPRSDGYGRMVIGSRSDGTRRSISAHVLSWNLHYGPVPDGLSVLHHCDNPICVNPRHLYVGTQADNNRDRRVRGRSPKRQWTHCIHNHEFTPDNTYIRRNGCRTCKTCARLRRNGGL